MTSDPLLNEQDGDPVRTNGTEVTRSPFLLVGDHAGNAIPSSLGDLGLSDEDRQRHIALDIGAGQLGLALARRLQAPFLWQHFSRLVCDCNRHPDDPDWAAASSDGTRVPGNSELTQQDVRARMDAVFEPYHAAIEAALEARRFYGGETILVSVHSFTPSMEGRDRPWEIGVLHDGREDEYARRVMASLQAVGGLTVGDNEPYDMDDTDYTIPRHAYPRGLPYIELEVRQDCLGEESDVERMAELLAEHLSKAAAE